jgi:predicted CoA-binding protein
MADFSSVGESIQILNGIASVLVVDWPSRDVPDTLLDAGFTVVVKSGPGPGDYTSQERQGASIVARKLDRPPEHVDLVYVYQPFSEFAGIVALTRELGAQTIWRQSGLSGEGQPDPHGCWIDEDESRRARSIVESAGLAYVDDRYIADAVRSLKSG